MSKNMAKFDEDHVISQLISFFLKIMKFQPANEIYKAENVQRFIQHKKKYTDKDLGTLSTTFKNTSKNIKKEEDSDI